eukprot:4333018-Amphidinium_carterae.1
MGRGSWKGSRSSNWQTKDEKPRNKTRLSAVDEWCRLTKKLLKPYPDERGSLVRTSGMALKQFLSAAHFRDAAANPLHNELVARPAMGLNLLASTTEQALEALQSITDERKDPACLHQCANLFQELADAMQKVQVSQAASRDELEEA